VSEWIKQSSGLIYTYSNRSKHFKKGYNFLLTPDRDPENRKSVDSPKTMNQRDVEVDAWLEDAGIVVESINEDHKSQHLPNKPNHSRSDAQHSSTDLRRHQHQRQSQSKFGVGMSDKVIEHSMNSSNGSFQEFGIGRTLGGDSSALEKSMKRKRKAGDEDEVLLELRARKSNNKTTTEKSTIIPRTESHNRKKKTTTLGATPSAATIDDHDDEDEGRSSLAGRR
jgi:hypothetical protein